MKRRKGVTVFSVLAGAFLVLAIASYIVIMLVVAPMFAAQAEEAKIIVDAFDILARNKDIIAAFTTFDTANLVPNILVFGYLGVSLVVLVIWLIVGLRRGRKICIWFSILFLCSMYVDLIYNLTVLPLENFITAYVESVPALLIPVGGAALGALASLFGLILFIVDMATGRVEKEAAPAFIKEPTEEVEEGVFEEVKDESEVEKKEEVAPAPVEEKVEEEKPVKKASAPKKVNKPEPKKAPAKKAEPKKAPAKKEEPKKAEPKKVEPKKEEVKKEDDARKTQTVTLTNEDGQVYAKAYHVSRRPELNKWQVKATGSDKALKLFNTQKEAIAYAEELGKNQNVGVRVHSKAGKIRKHQ